VLPEFSKQAHTSTVPLIKHSGKTEKGNTSSEVLFGSTERASDLLSLQSPQLSKQAQRSWKPDFHHPDDITKSQKVRSFVQGSLSGYGSLIPGCPNLPSL
jgi:hypothetical protein